MMSNPESNPAISPPPLLLGLTRSTGSSSSSSSAAKKRKKKKHQQQQRTTAASAAEDKEEEGATTKENHEEQHLPSKLHSLLSSTNNNSIASWQIHRRAFRNTIIVPFTNYCFAVITTTMSSSNHDGKRKRRQRSSNSAAKIAYQIYPPLGIPSIPTNGKRSIHNALGVSPLTIKSSRPLCPRTSAPNPGGFQRSFLITELNSASQLPASSP
mmetsp:Transcript_42764/g.72966  ORF Transcript_42764/g.72966 Transcript_42764/m.72966 type:complete len:212 (+) Transcript_42764:288-923(+)